MRRRVLPSLGHLFESGPDDRVYDSLLLAAPAVVLLLVVAGRSVFTAAVVVVYLLTFVTYVLYKGVR